MDYFSDNMDSKTIKVAVVAVIALIIVAAAAFIIINNGDGNGGSEDERTVQITQNDGKVIEVAVPVQKLCIVNTNAAEFATILGVSDRVVGVSDTMIKTPTESW